MTVLPSEERVKSVLRVANVASASSAVVQKSAKDDSMFVGLVVEARGLWRRVWGMPTGCRPEFEREIMY